MFAGTCSLDPSCGFCRKRKSARFSSEAVDVKCNGHTSPYPSRECILCRDDDYECCSSCPRGTGFNTTTGDCEFCPVGFVNAANDSVTCSECGQGAVSTNATEPCQVCAAGRYLVAGLRHQERRERYSEFQSQGFSLSFEEQYDLRFQAAAELHLSCHIRFPYIYR